MRVRISYKQKRTLNVYDFIRVIDFTPDNRFFKDKVEQQICSSFDLGKKKYVEEVRRTLQYSDEDIIHEIEPMVEERMSDPMELYLEITEYDREIALKNLGQEGC